MQDTEEQSGHVSEPKNTPNLIFYPAIEVQSLCITANLTRRVSINLSNLQLYIEMFELYVIG